MTNRFGRSKQRAYSEKISRKFILKRIGEEFNFGRPISRKPLTSPHRSKGLVVRSKLALRLNSEGPLRSGLYRLVVAQFAVSWSFSLKAIPTKQYSKHAILRLHRETRCRRYTSTLWQNWSKSGGRSQGTAYQSSKNQHLVDTSTTVIEGRWECRI